MYGITWQSCLISFHVAESLGRFRPLGVALRDFSNCLNLNSHCHAFSKAGATIVASCYKWCYSISLRIKTFLGLCLFLISIIQHRGNHKRIMGRKFKKTVVPKFAQSSNFRSVALGASRN